MVKVTDFSLSMFNSDRKPVKTCFPIKWSAPEVLMNGPYSTKSDVWSYGQYIESNGLLGLLSCVNDCFGRHELYASDFHSVNMIKG